VTEFSDDTFWKVEQLPVGSRSAKLPFNFVAYVEVHYEIECVHVLFGC